MGDPDGSGTATPDHQSGLREVCWTIEVVDVVPIDHAHNSQGVGDREWPIVVHLDPYRQWLY